MICQLRELPPVSMLVGSQGFRFGCLKDENSSWLVLAFYLLARWLGGFLLRPQKVRCTHMP